MNNVINVECNSLSELAHDHFPICFGLIIQFLIFHHAHIPRSFAPVLRYCIFFKKGNDFIVKEMISFVRGTLFKEEPCCKYMLKYDIKNHLRQFTKTFIQFQWSTTHGDLVMCNYVWLEHLTVGVKYGFLLDKTNCFIG